MFLNDVRTFTEADNDFKSIHNILFAGQDKVRVGMSQLNVVHCFMFKSLV